MIQTTQGEWWYLEDRHGNRGYVPKEFLKSYPTTMEELSATVGEPGEAAAASKASEAKNDGPTTEKR